MAELTTWLALVAERPDDADAAARAGDAGWLAVWCRAPDETEPVPGAVRMFGAIVDADGPAGRVSLVLVAPGLEPIFDDLAVQRARRRVFAEPWPGAVSTLLRDGSHFAGALRFAPEGSALGEDPFAAVAPARELELGPGLLRAVAPPAGPVIERYGSAQPWPGDRF